MFFLGLLVGVLLGLIGSLLIGPRVDDWLDARMVDNSADWQAFKKAFPVEEPKK